MLEGDRLKVCLDALVKPVVAVPRQVIPGAFQAAFGYFVGTRTMENSPRNRQTLGEFDGGPKLVFAGESPAIKINVQRPVLAQKIFGGGKHHGAAEIILLARVVGVRRAKNRLPDDIFIQ